MAKTTTRRAVTVIVAVVAGILIVGSAGVRFVALPALRQIPANLDTTVHLAGTADLMDASALASGDLTKAITPGVPVTVRERIHTVSTAGPTAVIDDDSTMTGPDQATLTTTTHRWSVDRTTLRPGDTSAPGTEAHDGLVVGFPLAPQPNDYPYWDTTTGTRTVATYQRTATHTSTPCTPAAR